MAWLLYLSARGAPLTPLQVAFLVTHGVGTGLTLLWWWALYRRLIGRPVGPSRDFVCALKEQPQIPPPPPNPNLDVWKPWFSLYGPLFLELKYGTGRIPTAWRARVHEAAAFRFYVEDRLPEAIEAAEKAIHNGTRPGLWAVKLLSIARAELDARENCVRIEQPPFVFELPAGDRGYDGLIGIAEACAARVRSLLGLPKQPTVFALLDEEQLRRDAGSSWGYMARKRAFSKICLLRPAGDGLLEASTGLLHEYVRLGVCLATAGRAPRWLTEGLAECVLLEIPEHVPGGPQPAIGLRRLRPSEKVLESMVRRSRLDAMADRGATAYGLVRRLLDTYGESAMRQFVTDLATRSEAKAFRSAFGLSQREFEREWAARAGEVA